MTQRVKSNTILIGDCLEQLKTLPDGCVDCCVTSPPYYGLRDYGTGKWIGGNPKCPHKRMSKYSDNTITGHHQPELAGNVGDAIYKTVCPLCGAIREDQQIGLEETPEQYIQRLVDVFREVKRVLKDDGTLWVNIGDTYNGKTEDDDRKPKDLIGIPWMLAFSLRSDGWYLRQDIIWAKTNPMPESVKDRCTKSHEYVFLLSKSQRYYFDNEAIKEPAKPDTTVRDRDHTKLNNTPGRTRMAGLKTNHYTTKNKRDVWMISTKPFKGAHFATFPEDLVEPCILTGSRNDGIVLDPFFGSGTTGVVALRHGRRFIGCELNPEYVQIARRRLNGVQMAYTFGEMQKW